MSIVLAASGWLIAVLYLLTVRQQDTKIADQSAVIDESRTFMVEQARLIAVQEQAVTECWTAIESQAQLIAALKANAEQHEAIDAMSFELIARRHGAVFVEGTERRH